MKRWWMISAVALALPIFAAAQTPLALPGVAGWTDAGHGCFVWNRSPTIGESASWAGPCVAQHANGKGVLIWRTGDSEQRYDGEFKDDLITGRGTLTISDGRKYEGMLLEGLPNGQGTLTDGSGTFVGTWKNGCLNEGGRRAALGVDPSTCK